MKTLEQLNFDNSFSKLPSNFYSIAKPTSFPNSYLISANEAACNLLDLDPSQVKRKEFVEYFSGQKNLPGSNPIAATYAGHQFGHFVPQLGDGRALLIGEVVNQKNERWDLQAKGSGKTPYSRGFDGRAVLRSSIREYLISEAMHALNIPTTRALCLIGTGEYVLREELEKGALIIRLSPSHVRFGTFEYFYYKNQYNDLKTLADYCIAVHFSHLQEKEQKYELFFEEIVKRTALLIAKWMAFGFTHGVLNTDNMSILGVTIDYGPYGFIDNYNRNYIPNHSDTSGRYSYINQPYIGLWNLTALAESLQPLIPKEKLEKILNKYVSFYQKEYYSLMHAKLGITNNANELIDHFLTLLQIHQVDYTIFFRKLSNFDINDIFPMFNQDSDFKQWFKKYEKLINQDNEKMKQVNPKFILRNYMAENAIKKAAEEDYSEIENLLKLLSHPFEEQEKFEHYALTPPAWSKEICISCSS